MDAIYISILKRALRALVSAVVGIGIPLIIQYLGLSTNPWIILASPLITAALMAFGKFLRDKFNLSNVPI